VATALPTMPRPLVRFSWRQETFIAITHLIGLTEV
jgi:hypothetical protein